MGIDMKHSDSVRSVVARFFNVAESEVTDTFLFPAKRLSGSVARTTLHSAIKRIAGVDLPSAFTANTYGQLVNHTIGSESGGESSLPVIQTSTSEPGGVLRDAGPERQLGLGVDVEFVDNLPWSGDPWTDSFYLENFTPREIAYCIRQTNPKLSLCGLWSAKEATIKCESSPGGLHPRDLEISHDDGGRPFARRIAANLEPVALEEWYLSISHSNNIAVAVSVRMVRLGNVADVKPENLPPLVHVPDPPKPPSGSFLSMRLLSWISLLLAMTTAILLLYHLASRR